MRTLRIFSVCLFMLFSASFVFAQAGDSNQMVLKTNELFNSGNFDEAVDYLNDYLKENKKDALATNLLARAYVGKGDVNSRRKAAKVFKKSIKMDKDNLEFRLYFGELMADMGDKWNAEQAFKYIVKKDPNYVQAQADLMQLYISKKDKDKVLAFEAVIAELKTKGLGKEKMTLLANMEENLNMFKSQL